MKSKQSSLQWGGRDSEIKPKTAMRFMPGTPAYRAYQAMLDKVRAANTHLSEAELDAKLCEARDNYVREICQKYK